MMKLSGIGSVRFFAVLGLSLGIAALTCNASPQNFHVGGLVPLAGSANDFHMKVAIEADFLLGEPINFNNGAFTGDGHTTSTDAGFTVDWAGSTVTGGGPYNFGFDILVNGPFDVTEAWWTLGGLRVPSGVDSTNYEGVFNPFPIPEPASLGLLALGMVAVSRRRKA